MLIGYARVATTAQNLELQLDDLNTIGCDKIFTDETSGEKEEREGLAKALELLQAGDVFAICKLDILERDPARLFSAINDLINRRVRFRSLYEGIDSAKKSSMVILATMELFQCL